ncbi:hypothetical protein C5167_043654 [Papaver somniferum]|uniref:Uncharacterized protein n=1 Tax=Papaver somniferum TaxID=3469 RepID=A0A4Y7L7Z8_PAPSO|nr:hypothetical protein C5167_043654 [Papaver somniferum]
MKGFQQQKMMTTSMEMEILSFGDNFLSHGITCNLFCNTLAVRLTVTNCELFWQGCIYTHQCGCIGYRRADC